MVKQTILWLLPANCLSVFDHFVVLVLKGLRLWFFRVQGLLSLFDYLSLPTAVINFLFLDTTVRLFQGYCQQRQVGHSWCYTIIQCNLINF